MVSLLKTEEGALSRIKALVLTDGGAFMGELCQEAIPSEDDVKRSMKPEAVANLRIEMEAVAKFVPAAFEPPSAEVLACVAAVGRNFVSSELPLGSVVGADIQGFASVSSGHTSHPSTTHAATEAVFEFLRLGPDGATAKANDELRATCA